MGEVKLIAATLSLFCTRVEFALKLKGIDYEYIEEDVSNKSGMLLQSNPFHKKVPVLIHNHKPVVESLIIIEYIDDNWNKYNSLMPRDPYERAMARVLAHFADEKCLFPAWGACCKAEGEEKSKIIESVIESFELLEKYIEGKKFFGGEQVGYLDLALGWIPHWLNILEEVGNMKILEAQKFPRLDEWGKKLIEIPEIKECLPPIQKLFNHVNASAITMLSMEAANKQ